MKINDDHNTTISVITPDCEAGNKLLDTINEFIYTFFPQ